MVERRPTYFDQFSCAAGACPDTCCAAWDIVIDKESAAFYNALPGPLGERVRSAMTVDEEGEPCFSVSGGACPLLSKERLCTIQLELGEARVCATCRSHPRFTEEYGSFKELALAASCPAAAELILNTDFALTQTETEEAPFTCEDVDEPLLSALLPCRETAFALLDREDLPWGQRLALLSAFGLELQQAIMEDDLAALPPLAAEWRSLTPEELSFPAPDLAQVRATRRRALALLGELEHLEQDWGAELAAALAALDATGDWAYWAAVHALARDEEKEARWTAYLLWRWFLRADFDGDVYGKLALPLLSLIALEELALARSVSGKGCSPAERMELSRRWAKEVEHSGENLTALWAAPFTDPALAPDRLMMAVLE